MVDGRESNAGIARRGRVVGREPTETQRLHHDERSEEWWRRWESNPRPKNAPLSIYVCSFYLKSSPEH